MKKIFIGTLLLLTAVLLSTSCAGRVDVKKYVANYNPGDGWKLVWQDEFNGTNLDPKKWSIEVGGFGWGNGELQWDTDRPDNVVVSNGNLYLVARAEQFEWCAFTSGRITSKDLYNIKYGKIVGKIKMPYSHGLWPAFWMLGENKPEVNWPFCGEIDIAELRGGPNYGDALVYGSLHYFKGKHTAIVMSDGNFENGKDAPPVPFYLDYHIFEVEWDKHFIRIKVDGDEYNTIDISSEEFNAFHQAFYILLDIAVGGNFVNISNSDLVTGTFPQMMVVDWVRAYQKEEK